MSIIKPEDFMRFFEENCGVQFIDVESGKPALQALQEQSGRMLTKKSDFDLWLEEQDEETKLEMQMGEL